MFHCERIERIGAYHDGELPTAEASALARHVEDCPACREELHRLRVLSGWLSAAPEVPPAAVERLRGAFQPYRSQSVLRLAKALTVAAAVVLLVCSAFLYRDTAVQQSPVSQPTEWERTAVVSSGDSVVPTTTITTQDPDVELAQSILATLVTGGGSGYD